MDTKPSGRVLILGADGFIGRHLAFQFRNTGHQVLCSARRTAPLARMGFEVISADLCNPATHQKAFWQGRLKDVDYVVNAAGLLTGTDARFEAVHISAPAAVYKALPSNARGVLISAVGTGAETPFARFRRKGEAVAKASPIPVTVLRSGLVLADSSYGGSSLIRALAALPFATPVIGSGDLPFNPIHAADLANVVIEILQTPEINGCFEIGGSEKIDQAGLFKAYWRWLGLPTVPLLRLSTRVARILGRLGDILKLGPISATSIAQLEAGVLADPAPLMQKLKFRPRGFSQFLRARPAGTQDIWQARLYFCALPFGLGLGLQ